jgi:hypothetical protein
MTKIRTVNIIDTLTGELEYSSSREVRMFLFDEDKGFLLFHNQRQVRRFIGFPLPAGVNIRDRAYLSQLVEQMEESNRLQMANAKKIAGAIGLSVRRTYLFLSRMLKLRVMAKTIDGYFINPLYFCAGKYLSKELYVIFKAELDPHLSDWVRERMEL